MTITSASFVCGSWLWCFIFALFVVVDMSNPCIDGQRPLMGEVEWVTSVPLDISS